MRWDTCNIFLSLTAQAKSANLYAERKKDVTALSVISFDYLLLSHALSFCMKAAWFSAV